MKKLLNNAFNNKIKQIFGISKKTKEKFFNKLGLNNRISLVNIKNSHRLNFNKYINKTLTDKRLEERIYSFINFQIKNKTNRGYRHSLRYPVRGQRTHTNGKTRKKHKR